jgi:parallel beta-helix repeat protein
MLEVSKLAIPLVAGFLLCGNASAQNNILYVSPKGKVRNHVAYTTIQAAVNAAQPGDGIQVESATYTEEVSVVNKGSLFLHAVGVANNGPPTLNGSISCTATKLTVLGFTIHPQAGNSGIYFTNAPGSYASGNKITGCSVDAIDIYNSSNCTVTSNEIDNSSYAIGIRSSEYLVITNNHGSGVPQVFEYSMPDATDTVTNNNFTP